MSPGFPAVKRVFVRFVRPALALAPLILSGCLIVPIPMPGPAPWDDGTTLPPGQCGAASIQQHVGFPVELLRFPEGTRFHAHGTSPGGDFVDARLNVDVEGTGLVTRIWCG